MRNNVSEEAQEAEKMERIRHTALQGSQIRQWCKMPAFAIYKHAIEQAVEKKKAHWLKGDTQRAKEAYWKAEGLNEALEILKKFLATGEFAKRSLRKIAED
jgi:hypothetical protein